MSKFYGPKVWAEGLNEFIWSKFVHCRMAFFIVNILHFHPILQNYLFQPNVARGKGNSRLLVMKSNTFLKR